MSNMGNVKDPKSDDFKWFGEGFDGFPKKLPDDCVEYSIYVIDATITDAQLRERLRKIQAAGNALTKKLLQGFIWQRESFGLEIVRGDGASFLRGRTNYGDSIEDEWVIVYLLRELSRRFQEAWVKVMDSDGEFLLIEAANVLPRWLNPEIADNRVWINNGDLIIIPRVTSLINGKAVKTKTHPGNITLQEAHKQILGDRSKLLHSPLIEEEAFYRLRNYPIQIQENLHNSIVTIPRNLAYVIHENPACISPAIEAFYLRDPIALRPLQDRNGNSLIFPPEDFVNAQVKFTKVGFAQVKSQQFPAPPAWENVEYPVKSHEAKAKAETGMRVTCGFEMLLQDPQNQDKKVSREIKLLLEDLESGEVPLPLDSEIEEWGTADDDDKWMNIDFRDFEKELSGKPGNAGSGFGDRNAHENLQKMALRFEEFLNDDTADFDEMDDDDDEYSEENSDTSGEDRVASFDEDEFTKMIRETMGMPPETMRELMGSAYGKPKSKDKIRNKVAEHELADSDDDEEIQQLSALMEKELKTAGALHLDEPLDKFGALKIRPKEVMRATVEDAEDSSYEDPLDEDFNLVKNMMQSFKSQAGRSGPGGNIMSMMGMQLPRDEGGSDEDEKLVGSKR